MAKKIKVLQHGVGVVGKAITRNLVEKTEIEIVGAVDVINIGKDLGEVAGLNRKLGIIISNDLDAVLSQTRPDVMLDASVSHTSEAFPFFMKAIEAGASVITTGEELFNPWLKEPELARKLDEAAKKHKVGVKGTGSVPGFMLDVLPLTFTGICKRVKKITVDRCLDSAEWAKSPTIRKIDGYGVNKAVADKMLASGEITLHVGIPEEMAVLADCLG